MRRSRTPVVQETARTTVPERQRYSESGDTLIEVLLALIVLGMASVALIIAFSTSISASAEHRKLANYDTVLATATQETIAAVQSELGLFSCPHPTVPAYTSPAANITAYPGYVGSGIPLPLPYTGNYTVKYDVTSPVQYWNTTTESFGSLCQANEPQLIKIDLIGTTYTNSFVVDYPVGSSNSVGTGTATQLIFLQQPVGGYAGSPFTTQPIVEITTDGINPMITDLSPVILTLTQGTGVLSGCIGNEVLGVVTFSGCTIGTGGSNFQITATDGTLIPATSNPFSVSSSTYHLVFTTPPGAGQSGTAFSQAPVVTVENALNNTDISWAGTITLTLSGGALSAVPGQTCLFTTATTITLTPLIGVGTVTMPSGCAFSGGFFYDSSRSPPTTATQYTMTATANPNTPSDAAVPATSTAFSVTSPGPASQIAFVTQPTGVASATATTPFTGQPTVAVEDSFGNVVTSATNTINMAINSGGQGVTLSNCNSPTPTIAGLYVFSGCYGSKWGTSLTLTASSTGLTSAVSTAFDITNIASQLLFTTSPVAGDSGSVFAIPPVLVVEDNANRVVTAATTPITFNAVVPSGGTLSSCTGMVPQLGIITVENCTFAGVVGTQYTVTASEGSLTSVPSSSFSPTGPGPASQLVFTTQPVAGVSGTAFTTQPVVKVEDSAGNIVTSSTASITLKSSGGALSGCTGLTASAGIVTLSNCTFAGVVGAQYTLTATSGSLTSAPSSNFSPTYAGVPSQIILSGCPTAIVSLSTCVATATLEDAYANLETLDNSSIITFSQAPGGGTVSGLTSPTVSGGVANVTLTGGSQGLALVSATGDSLTSNTLTVTVNAATTTVVASSSNPSVVGQTVTYTAKVTVNSAGTGTPSGNIEFLDNGTAIGICGGAGGVTVNGSGQVTCAVSWPTTATQTITAQYLGNAGAYYLGSTSSALSQTVNKAATTTAVTSGTNPSLVGQTVTYIATVTATNPGSGVPTGNIEFFDGVTAISTCGGAGGVAVSSASATCAVSWPTTVTQTITAQYLGDANYLASTSSALSQAVNKAATTTAVTSGTNPSVVGRAVSYVATVTATSPGSGVPTGNVEFFDGGTAISTCGGAIGVAVISGSATCAVTYAAPGTHTITAQYLGDTNYLASALSSSVSQVVNQAPAITSASSTTFTVGSAGSFTVTDTGFPAPTLANANFSGCTISTLPSGVTFTAATGVLAGTPAAGTGGTYTLCLNASNVAGSATQTFTLKVPSTVTYASAGTYTLTVTAHTTSISFTIVGGGGGSSNSTSGGGGNGGSLKGTITLPDSVNATTFTVVVGGGGGAGGGSVGAGGTGGTGCAAGGAGGTGSYDNAGGAGGATCVYVQGLPGSVVAVAAGGGGAGSRSDGGAGGLGSGGAANNGGTSSGGNGTTVVGVGGTGGSTVSSASGTVSTNTGGSGGSGSGGGSANGTAGGTCIIGSPGTCTAGGQGGGTSGHGGGGGGGGEASGGGGGAGSLGNGGGGGGGGSGYSGGTSTYTIANSSITVGAGSNGAADTSPANGGAGSASFTGIGITAGLVYSATGTATTFTTSGSHTVNYPTGTNTNDLLFLVVENSANNSPATPTGWTLLTDQSMTSPQAMNFAVYWKLAAGETSVLVTDTGTGTGASAWVIQYVRPGGYPPNPVLATAAVQAGNAAASATLTPSPDVTTNLASATAISIVAIRAANTLSFSTPHGFAFENTVTSTPGTASLALGVGDQFVPTVGGSDTSPTWSQTGTAAQWAWVTVAFS